MERDEIDALRMELKTRAGVHDTESYCEELERELVRVLDTLYQVQVAYQALEEELKRQSV
jgi:hypothetical protein